MVPRGVPSAFFADQPHRSDEREARSSQQQAANTRCAARGASLEVGDRPRNLGSRPIFRLVLANASSSGPSRLHARPARGLNGHLASSARAKPSVRTTPAQSAAPGPTPLSQDSRRAHALPIVGSRSRPLTSRVRRDHPGTERSHLTHTVVTGPSASTALWLSIASRSRPLTSRVRRDHPGNRGQRSVPVSRSLGR